MKSFPGIILLANLLGIYGFGQLHRLPVSPRILTNPSLSGARTLPFYATTETVAQESSYESDVKTTLGWAAGATLFAAGVGGIIQ